MVVATSVSLLMKQNARISRWSKATTLTGISTAVICMITIVLGGALQTGYSQKYHTLSRLTAYDGPYYLTITIIFIVYNIFLILTGVGWFIIQKRAGEPSATAARLIVVTGLIGLALVSFPQDPDDAPMSVYGVGHKVMAIGLMLSALAAMIAQGMHEMEKGMVQLSLYTNATVMFVVISGSLATLSIESDWIFGAVLERVTLIGFLTWIVVESIVLYKRFDRRGSHRHKVKKL